MAAFAAGASTAAHRRDEYLQAARLAIDPARVQVELDLTPGIAVADAVLGAIDADRDGAVSPSEADGYAGTVMRAVSLEIDGRPLTARVTGSVFPPVDAVRRGEGTIRLQISAAPPQLDPGTHQLRYRNAHRPDIGVYLANALVPSNERIAVTDQQRDVDQRELRIAYVLRAETGARRSRWIVPGLVVLTIASAVLWVVRAAGDQPARQRKTSR